MQIIEIPHSLRLDDGEGRSPGIHQSDVIREVALRIGALHPKYGGKDSIDILKVSLGLAWEDYLSKVYPNIAFHPGEYVTDGIAQSPDGISFYDGNPEVPGLVSGQPIIHEFKLTWKSTSRSIEDDFMWMSQGKGYCRGVGTNVVRWHVFYVNGNYKRDETGGPQFKTYNVIFTDKEIEDNWRMIVNARHLVTK